jgi:elongation factor 3
MSVSNDPSSKLLQLEAFISLSDDDICNQLEQISEFIHKDNELSLIDRLLPRLISVYNNKSKKSSYDTIFEHVKKIISFVDPWYTPYLADTLCDIISSSALAQKKYSYMMLSYLIQQNSSQIKISMPRLVPMVSSDVNDIVSAIKESATMTLEVLLKSSGNMDLDAFTPVVLNGIKKPDTIYDCIEALASCVFVQNVEAPALAITLPVIQRGLLDKKTATRRLTCVIIDNMCKLIEHPKEILPFYSKLKTDLERCVEVMSDPDARKVALRALNTLKESCSENENAVFHKQYSDFKETLISEYTQHQISFSDSIIQSQSILVTTLCNSHCFDKSVWTGVFQRYLGDNDDRLSTLEPIVDKVYQIAKDTYIVKDFIFEDTEEGKDLYKGEFSLAYGALTLLNTTHLHLKQNRFYGLLGPNNCGKTTLMRAISKEQIDGFPKKDELRTIFVEHEIQEMEVGEDEKGFPILNIDLCGIDWVVHCCNVVYSMEPPVTPEQVEKVMMDIGFGYSKKDIGKDRAADMGMGITTYSGGWKVKMQLCAATLMNADILMLDEPTGHLDVTNIAWIKNWLKGFMENGGSIIATSHDSSFLNEMCTHLIDFQSRKLRMFTGAKGNVLQEFVDKYPEKKSYFELRNDVVKFKFPEPGELEGVKSKSKTLLKMTNVTFQYPTRDTPTIFDINLECSRISRVGVIGANGAGKSTAIKILIGELKPMVGVVTKHPDLRMAYIAQHAFHHLEKHLHKTPTQYIMWRFAGNEDKEGLENIEKGSDEDVKIVKYILVSKDTLELKECETPSEEKSAVEVDQITARRENRKLKLKEYEVSWKNKSEEMKMWVKRDILLKMGATKLVQRHDEKEAVMAGLASKNLTTKDIEKHFADFGIEPEQANHTLIKSLSGGQKVKVVLAASLWQNPHLVILDEPTNYLDRDGLGALTSAIHNFNGGVVIISHNREFTNAVTTEKWIMEKGRLRKEGESVEKESDKKDTFEEQNKTVFDSFGNEIKVEKEVKLTDKDKKKLIKSLQKQIKDGKKKGTLSSDELCELEDKLDKLQTEE